MTPAVPGSHHSATVHVSLPPLAPVALLLSGLSLGVLACDPAARDDDGSARASASADAIVDDAGRALDRDPTRVRVISLIPAVTDLIVSLGARDQLAGRTRFDVSPEVAALPSVGGGLDPSLEAIRELDPDLVVVWRDSDVRSVAARLQDVGVPTYVAEYQTLADVRRHAAQLGTLLGRPLAADSLVRWVDDNLIQLATLLRSAERPSLLYVVSVDPLITTGGGTFVDSLMSAAGGVNVFRDLTVEWPQVGLEEAVTRQPDWVVLSTSENDGSGLAARAGWRDMDAVRAGRVLWVDPDLFNRPGPGLVRAAWDLAGTLHPSRIPEGP